MDKAALADFAQLAPDRGLNLVASALGRRASNLCWPLGSDINRVYDIQLDDGTWVAAKGCRPNRWSRAALQDELDFVAELAAEEIPVMAPMPGPDGTLLHERHGMLYAVYPKRGDRALEEPLHRVVRAAANGRRVCAAGAGLGHRRPPDAGGPRPRPTIARN